MALIEFNPRGIHPDDDNNDHNDESRKNIVLVGDFNFLDVTELANYLPDEVTLYIFDNIQAILKILEMPDDVFKFHIVAIQPNFHPGTFDGKFLRGKNLTLCTDLNPETTIPQWTKAVQNQDEIATGFVFAGLLRKIYPNLPVVFWTDLKAIKVHLNVYSYCSDARLVDMNNYSASCPNNDITVFNPQSCSIKDFAAFLRMVVNGDDFLLEDLPCEITF